MNRKKVLLIIIEILIGSGSVIGSSAMTLDNPGAVNILSSSTALLSSIAILKTNESFSNLKNRYTKLRHWINVITLLYEKTLKESMIVKKMIKKKSSN